MTRDTSSIGAISEAAVAAALVRAGKAVYAPLFGAHSRTDLVVEDAAGLHRVQCKTGRLVDDHRTTTAWCSAPAARPAACNGPTRARWTSSGSTAASWGPSTWSLSRTSAARAPSCA